MHVENVVTHPGPVKGRPEASSTATDVRRTLTWMLHAIHAGQIHLDSLTAGIHLLTPQTILQYPQWNQISQLDHVSNTLQCR